MKHYQPTEYGLTTPIPRVVRFEASFKMPSDDCVATLDFEHNLLRVNLALYRELTPSVQNTVLKTHLPVLRLSDLPNN